MESYRSFDSEFRLAPLLGLLVVALTLLGAVLCLKSAHVWVSRESRLQTSLVAEPNLASAQSSIGPDRRSLNQHLPDYFSLLSSSQ